MFEKDTKMNSAILQLKEKQMIMKVDVLGFTEEFLRGSSGAYHLLRNQNLHGLNFSCPELDWLGWKEKMVVLQFFFQSTT